jgi:hypothetical protein
VNPRESEVTAISFGRAISFERAKSFLFPPKSLCNAPSISLPSFHIHLHSSTVDLPYFGHGEGDTFHELPSTPTIYRSLLTTDENETKFASLSFQLIGLADGLRSSASIRSTTGIGINTENKDNIFIATRFHSSSSAKYSSC